MRPGEKIIVVSRCAWTLYNFRSGLIRALQAHGAVSIGGGAGGDGTAGDADGPVRVRSRQSDTRVVLLKYLK